MLRHDVYPNIASLMLNKNTTLEVHEYPDKVDGELTNKTLPLEMEKVSNGEWIIRGLGFKLRLVRK